MVCLGNICRSPIAEGVMRHLVNEQNLHWHIDSAGTGSWHTGQAPHKDSQKVCRINGIDISTQKARQFKSSDFEEFDHIIVMDKQNYQDVKSMAGSRFVPSKISLLLDHCNEPGLEVPDPYYGNYEDYEHVFQLITNATKAFIDKHSNHL